MGPLLISAGRITRCSVSEFQLLIELLVGKSYKHLCRNLRDSALIADTECDMKANGVVSFAAAVLALCAGCTGGNGSGGQSACSAFRTTLSINDRMSQVSQTFVPGEDITFVFEISNTTTYPIILTAGSSCTAVIFEVFDNGAQRKWGSADNIACIAMLQPRTYAPYESVTYTSVWNQHDSGSAQVPSGNYQVTATAGQYATDNQGRLFDCKATLGKTASFTIL